MSLIADNYSDIKKLKEQQNNLAILELENPLDNIPDTLYGINSLIPTFVGEYTSFSVNDKGFMINKKCLATLSINVYLTATTPLETVNLFISRNNITLKLNIRCYIIISI